MEGRRRRSFTDDYKRRAVDLVASSGGSIGVVAPNGEMRRASRRELLGVFRLLWIFARRPAADKNECIVCGCLL